MTIDKLIHFKTKEAFLNTSDIQETDIVFIKDTDEIYTHGERYQFVGWNAIDINVPLDYYLFTSSDGHTLTGSDKIFLTK